MLEFKKMDDNLKKALDIEDAIAYSIARDNVVVGYGLINNNKENKIEIIIKDEYQGNGYGKFLFGKMLNEYHELGNNDITLVIPQKNVRIKNIIIFYNGIHLTTNKDKETYIIPLK